MTRPASTDPLRMPSLLVRAFLLALFTLGGCSTIDSSNSRQHIVMFDRNGFAVEPSGSYRRLAPDQQSAHITELLRSIRAYHDAQQASGQKTKLLLFIHGGLNDQDTTVKRAVRWSKRISGDQSYPIFVNWDSGLISSYAEHLFCIRQSEDVCLRRKELAKDPSNFLYPIVHVVGDLTRAAVRAVPLWLNQLFRADEAYPDTLMPRILRPQDQVESETIYGYLKEDMEQNPDGAIAVSMGEDRIGTLEFLARYYPTTILLLPVRMLSTALVDAVGKSVWENLCRRVYLLFDYDPEYHTDSDLDARRHLHGHEEGIGGLSVFLRRLREEVLQPAGSDIEVTLIGHSMGAMVVNELLRRYSDLRIHHIVYMAAASSIRDYEASVFPYLKRHADLDVKVYHMTLHPKAEVRWGKKPSGFKNILANLLSPPGSLLVWIDDFLAKPETHLDRTLGRWTNLVRALHNTPADLRGKIHAKSFNAGVEEEPYYHEDFDDCRFWDPMFWDPRPANAAQYDCYRESVIQKLNPFKKDEETKSSPNQAMTAP